MSINNISEILPNSREYLIINQLIKYYNKMPNTNLQNHNNCDACSYAGCYNVILSD